jgi:hypothetical protein
MENEEKQIPLFGEFQTFINVEKDPVESGLEQMEDRAFTRYAEKHYAMIDKIEELGLPAKGQQFRLITRRTFNAIQFLEYIVHQENVIVDLKMAIYSINYYAAKILIGLIEEGKIKKAEILMSNLRNKAHREKEEIVKEMFIGNPNISLFFASSHAKMFSCRTRKGNYYTLEGSGNLAYNSRVEQYVIDNDKAMYEFSCSWMNDIKEFLKDKNELEVC